MKTNLTMVLLKKEEPVRRFVDLPGLDVTANLKDFNLRWSLQQQLALARALRKLEINPRRPEPSAEVSDEDD